MTHILNKPQLQLHENVTEKPFFFLIFRVGKAEKWKENCLFFNVEKSIQRQWIKIGFEGRTWSAFNFSMKFWDRNEIQMKIQENFIEKENSNKS